jgi:hypothetical protein
LTLYSMEILVCSASLSLLLLDLHSVRSLSLAWNGATISRQNHERRRATLSFCPVMQYTNHENE